MAGASRINADSAGSTIIGPGCSTVFVNGQPISIKGDKVTPHSPINTPHMSGPVMIGSSSTVFAGGVAVVRAGDTASCGHAATGSGNVNIG